LRKLHFCNLGERIQPLIYVLELLNFGLTWLPRTNLGQIGLIRLTQDFPMILSLFKLPCKLSHLQLFSPLSRFVLARPRWSRCVVSCSLPQIIIIVPKVILKLNQPGLMGLRKVKHSPTLTFGQLVWTQNLEIGLKSWIIIVPKLNAQKALRSK